MKDIFQSTDERKPTFPRNIQKMRFRTYKSLRKVSVDKRDVNANSEI